jgi:hypothetical protein
MRPKEGFKVRRMLVSPGDLVIKIKSNRIWRMSSAVPMNVGFEAMMMLMSTELLQRMIWLTWRTRFGGRGW